VGGVVGVDAAQPQVPVPRPVGDHRDAPATTAAWHYVNEVTELLGLDAEAPPGGPGRCPSAAHDKEVERAGELAKAIHVLQFREA
jgi:hypothetical protein